MARCGCKYTATVVGRAAKQWGRQPSGWWGLRASLSMGRVFYTIVMTNEVGWPVTASDMHHDDPTPSMYMSQSPSNDLASIQKQLYLLT